MTIYGDWNGEFSGSYKTVDDNSNFIIIDKAGVIQYFYTGQISEDEFLKIIRKIKMLAVFGK